VAGAICLLGFLAAGFRPVVDGDGVGYFGYLHAVLVRHDLDLAATYAAAAAADVNTDPAILEQTTATGRRADFFPIGPALIAMPAYLAVLSTSTGRNEFAPVFVGAFTVASLLCGLLALAICWRLAGSLVAVVATALATPYVYYLLFEPSYSHTFSAFAVSLFVLVWWRGRDGRSALGWAGLGALVGLMAVIRWQDGAMGAIALLGLPGKHRWRPLLMPLGALPVLLPQLLVDRAIFGTWWPQRPPGQALDPGAGHQLDVLLSSWHGLFVWHPVTLAAAAGALLVRERPLRVACLYALLVQTLVCGAAPDWWGGAAFGARRFVDLAPFWAIGLAALAERVPPALAWASAVVAGAWNAALMANFLYVIRTDHDPGYLGLLAGQLAAVRYLSHLARGVVVRDLLPWPAPGGPPAWSEGLAWLAVEAATVVLVLAVARGRRRQGA